MHAKLPGVYQDKKKDGSVHYRSSVTFHRKHISLGSYSSPDEAHQAYLQACALLEDSKITLDDFSSPCRLPFDKWVSLINFRDNGLYIHTPIYIRKNYFDYFLSPGHALKFDIDDLFYYSSHRIMRRSGHLFVADYGMQVNILNRYGIMNYAVPGRDYRFVNGDELDFRYQNIEIINRYRGVQKIRKGSREVYRTSIHLNGNYSVGTYDTETEAAIAYNKAADILKKAGVNKRYALNYLEGLSPAVYADIYSAVPISEKILNYKPISPSSR